jgi:hypothetical protein
MLYGIVWSSAHIVRYRLIWLRYKVYVELHRFFSNDNLLLAVHLARPGLGIKAWVEVRDPLRASPVGRGGEVRLYAPYGEGLSGVSWRCLAGGGPVFLSDLFHTFRFRASVKIGPAVLV